MSNVETAVRLAERGFHVFPITAKLKHPPLVLWKTQATANPNIVTEWWAQWPTANIGLATGKRSGVFVFDVDMKKGKNGEAELAKLEEKHGPLPPTIETLTPHHGRQIWFRMPEHDVKCSTDKVAIGLDIKASGGYVLVPPSYVSDEDGAGHYQRSVDSAKDFADAPDWLLQAAGMPKHKEPRAASHWDRIIKGVPNGSRNEDLASLIGKLVWVLPAQSVLNVALAVDAQNIPPLGETKVVETVNSILKREAERRGRQVM